MGKLPEIKHTLSYLILQINYILECEHAIVNNLKTLISVKKMILLQMKSMI